jgi:hypothetical protein
MIEFASARKIRISMCAIDPISMAHQWRNGGIKELKGNQMPNNDRSESKPYWNPRREDFAQALARGLGVEEAGATVGYSKANARRNARLESVMARVAELRAPAQAKAAQKLEITLQSLIERAEAAYVMAKEQKQPNAMVNAVREMAVLTGNRVEKKEVGQAGQFDHLSDDELRKEIMERMEVLRGQDPSETQH